MPQARSMPIAACRDGLEIACSGHRRALPTAGAPAREHQPAAPELQRLGGGGIRPPMRLRPLLACSSPPRRRGRATRPSSLSPIAPQPTRCCPQMCSRHAIPSVDPPPSRPLPPACSTPVARRDGHPPALAPFLYRRGRCAGMLPRPNACSAGMAGGGRRHQRARAWTSRRRLDAPHGGS